MEIIEKKKRKKTLRRKGKSKMETCISRAAVPFGFQTPFLISYFGDLKSWVLLLENHWRCIC